MSLSQILIQSLLSYKARPTSVPTSCAEAADTALTSGQFSSSFSWTSLFGSWFLCPHLSWYRRPRFMSLIDLLQSIFQFIRPFLPSVMATFRIPWPATRIHRISSQVKHCAPSKIHLLNDALEVSPQPHYTWAFLSRHNLFWHFLF